MNPELISHIIQRQQELVMQYLPREDWMQNFLLIDELHRTLCRTTELEN